MLCVNLTTKSISVFSKPISGAPPSLSASLSSLICRCSHLITITEIHFWKLCLCRCCQTVQAAERALACTCVCARAWTQSLCHRLIGVCETDRQRRAGGKKGESSHNLICVYGSLSISRSLSEKLDGTDAISSQHNRAFVSPLTRARACVVHWPATIAACMESSTLSKPPCWLKRRRLWMFFCLGKQTVYKVCRQDACSKPGWFWS